MKRIIISVYIDNVFYREEFSENEIDEAIDFIKLAGEQFDGGVDSVPHLTIREA